MKARTNDARIYELKESLLRGEIDRRGFLNGLVAFGVSASTAKAMLRDIDAIESQASSMGSKTFRITGYNIHLGDKLLLSIGGRPVAPRAIIECTGDNQEQVNLHFLSTARQGDQNDSDKHPNTTSFTSNRVVGNMFLPVQQYTWYVDMLRNEDPVYATLDSSQPLNNRIWCGEQVGDGELREIVG